MDKKLMMVLGLLFIVFALDKLSFGESPGCGGNEQGSHPQSAAVTSVPQAPSGGTAPVAVREPVKVGNKICPVMGGKVDENITYEYEGKIYNFCCRDCISEFKKDPQKYIQKEEEELKAEKK